MDSLRPDRDDLDLYKSRKNKAVAPASGGGLGSQEALRGGVRQSSVDATSVSAARSATKSTGQNAGLKWVLFLLLLLVLVCAGLSAMLFQQVQAVDVLERRLSNTDEFIGQNKLLMARLEGEVSETEAELEETGSVAGKKLDVLESEVRKLWGVAYDRNRKTLKAHDDRLKKLDAAQLKTEKQGNKIGADLKELGVNVGKHVKTLDGRVASVSGELSIVRAEQDEFLQKLNNQLKLLEQRAKAQEELTLKVNEGVKVNKLSIDESVAVLASVDESRRQLIKRVVDLESRLNELSLAASSTAVNKPK